MNDETLWCANVFLAEFEEFRERTAYNTFLRRDDAVVERAGAPMPANNLC